MVFVWPGNHVIIMFFVFGRILLLLMMMMTGAARRGIIGGDWFSTVFVVVVRDRISLTDFVKVRFVSGIGTEFALAKARGCRPFHPLDQMGHSL